MLCSVKAGKSMPEGLGDINVSCGDNRAVFNTSSWKITFQGEEMTPTEFERRSGRGAAKKWKCSLRVITNGQDKGQVGNWLEANGLLPAGPKRAAAPEVLQEREAAARRRPAKKIVEHLHVEEEVERSHRSRMTPAKLLAHLDKQNLGFRPGDPTVRQLPQTCSARAEQGCGPASMEVDLRTFPEDQLRQMCLDSAESPLGDLLKVQPGVERHRMAYFTGRQPKRKTVSLDKLDGKILHDYVDGKTELPSYVKLPMVAGKEVNLRRLWREVQEAGGYVECTTSKLWAATAAKLGIDCSTSNSAGGQLRKVYLGVLLDKERSQFAVRPGREPAPPLRSSQEPPQPPPIAAADPNPSAPATAADTREGSPMPQIHEGNAQTAEPSHSVMLEPLPVWGSSASAKEGVIWSGSAASPLFAAGVENGVPKNAISGPVNILVDSGSSGGHRPEPLDKGGVGVGSTLGNGGLVGEKRKWSGEVDGGSMSIPGLD